MNKIYSFTVLLFSLLTVIGMASSCDINMHEDPDHPSYVTYTISAGEISFSGPDQLLLDIQAWIKSNQISYDTQVSYTTGEASEFARTDAEAVKRYEEFLPKFRAYLDHVDAELARGTYGNVEQVKATFYVFASRAQGKGNDIRYEHIEFSYPKTASN